MKDCLTIQNYSKKQTTMSGKRCSQFFCDAVSEKVFFYAKKSPDGGQYYKRKKQPDERTQKLVLS